MHNEISNYFQNYFNENFDIGISLHACGVATDLVLAKCWRKCATFVSSPCCYGKIQNLGCLPQCAAFSKVLSADEMIKISHCADQTHDVKNVKHATEAKTHQGYFCMDVIDTDRLLRSRELGYVTQLKRLYPEECTPKNRLLVGVHPRKGIE